jgi:DDE superfamily endonuclease
MAETSMHQPGLIMELYDRLEQIISELRPAFSRETTFNWFVLLLWSTLLTTQSPAITTYVNTLGLDEGYYHQALHWFRSAAFSIDNLCYLWSDWLSQHPNTKKLNGQLVYVGDGIKVSKEGRKMPGVKRLHQESANVSKPEWIRGHYFSALGILLGDTAAIFATPMIIKLHDGVEAVHEEGTLVDKMVAMFVGFAVPGSYILLDAYYAAKQAVQAFREKRLHLITRVRSTTVASAEFSSIPGKRGRPRLWGTKLKLSELFAPLENCLEASISLYGKKTTVHYQYFELYWDNPNELVLFVLTQLPNGKRLILLSTDTSLTGEQVIEAYSWRFKIEVTFRTLLQLLGGFGYQFWLKSMKSDSRWPKNMILAKHSEDFQVQVKAKVEAFERFVNLNAISIGLLQVIALEIPTTVWQNFPGWFRTCPQHGYPSEQIVRLSIQNQEYEDLSRSRPHLLLIKLLASKSECSQPTIQQSSTV